MGQKIEDGVETGNTPRLCRPRVVWQEHKITCGNLDKLAGRTPIGMRDDKNQCRLSPLIKKNALVKTMDGQKTIGHADVFCENNLHQRFRPARNENPSDVTHDPELLPD